MSSGLGFRVGGISGVYGFETEPRWSRFCLTRLAGDGLLTLSLVCFCLEQRFLACSLNGKWIGGTARGLHELLKLGLRGLFCVAQTPCDSKPHFLDYRTPIEASTPPFGPC